MPHPSSRAPKEDGFDRHPNTLRARIDPMLFFTPADGCLFHGRFSAEIPFFLRKICVSAPRGAHCLRWCTQLPPDEFPAPFPCRGFSGNYGHPCRGLQAPPLPKLSVLNRLHTDPSVLFHFSPCANLNTPPSLAGPIPLPLLCNAYSSFPGRYFIINLPFTLHPLPSVASFPSLPGIFWKSFP